MTLLDHMGRPWGADALEVDGAQTLPSDGATIWMPLRVLAHFNKAKAVDLLVRRGVRRRVAKRQVTRMLKIERLKKKRTPR